MKHMIVSTLTAAAFLIVPQASISQPEAVQALTIGADGRFASPPGEDLQISYRYTTQTAYRPKGSSETIIYYGLGTIKSTSKSIYYKIGTIKGQEAEAYLLEVNARIKIKDAYPQGNNPYQLPQLRVWKGGDVRNAGIYPPIDEDAIKALEATGYVNKNDANSNIEFCPVEFSKNEINPDQTSMFFVVRWWPCDLLNKASGSKKNR